MDYKQGLHKNVNDIFPVKRSAHNYRAIKLKAFLSGREARAEFFKQKIGSLNILIIFQKV